MITKKAGRPKGAPNGNELITKKEAAEIVGISYAAICDWEKKRRTLYLAVIEYALREKQKMLIEGDKK